MAKPTMWLPGAERVKPSTPGGEMSGGPSRVVWHTTESGTGDRTFDAAVRYLRSKGSEPHLVWDPTTGRIAQFFPANVSARTVKNDAKSGERTNRTGAFCIQIEVLGRAKDPFTDGPMKGLPKLIAWLTALGIPPVFPAGNPLPYPQSYGVNNPQRDLKVWRTKAGHYGHSQVPGNDHGDPGKIDVKKLFAPLTKPANPVAEKPVAPVPDPAPVKPAPAKPAPKPTMPASVARIVIEQKKTLRRGMTDSKAVAELQKRLNAVLGTKLATEGDFGPRTQEAVRAFQRRHGLAPTGEVGHLTAARLWPKK